MEVALATAFVSPVVKVVITKVSTYCSQEIARFWGVKSELEKLTKTLEKIDAVLLDAEEKQVQNRLVKLWLEELKDVIYDAEDVLALLQHKDHQRQRKTIKPVARVNIIRKIKEVNTKFDDITKEMERFKFLNQLGCSGSNSSMHENRSETSSHINDSAAVVGRQDNLSEVLHLLNQESYSVVRIIGMGGIGKTTLARLVYANTALDNSLKDHFVAKMWASLSRKPDVKEIFGDLLSLDSKERKSSLETIQNRLKKQLEKGKCLIILDDVWINHGIDVEELLKDILSMSGQGSKILMTMRSAEPIPPRTGCRYTIYQLSVLPEDDCWSMIKKAAFGDGGAKETTDLIDIGKRIAKKCGGLPLAAKTLGGLLYSRNDEDEWLSILRSPILNLPTGEKKIISILKLSYDHLLPYVKRCFSYCSIFPKARDFSKNELIKMWMAEGFLNGQQPNSSPETVGKEYFKILLLNSFFQDGNKDRYGDIKSYRMHDLVHDLAILIAGSESLMLKENDPEVIKDFSKLRRLGIHLGLNDFSATPSEMFKASKVHTFVFSSSYGFEGEASWAKQIFNFSLLRVLDLSWTSIEELPQSICKLKYLRYLDLSHTLIETFPSSFSQLYNLQTLRVKRCNLNELPVDMAKLIGLEYFSYSTDEDSHNFTKMPKELSRLSKLKKLSTFIVGIGEGYGIEELKDLNLLGGKLIIQNLENVTDAKQANMMGKKNIKHLELRWDWDFGLGHTLNPDPIRLAKDTRVLTELQPHRNLRKLVIHNFYDFKFPSWVSTSISVHLPNLVCIELWNCSNCEHLPALGQLQSLRYLYMYEMRSIITIGSEFYRTNEEASSSNDNASFPSLVELYIDYFDSLLEWFGDQRSTSSFSRLEKLEIKNCFRLSTTPTKFPALKNLDFKIVLENKLKDPEYITSLPLKLFWGANLLQALVVKDCDDFVGFLSANEEEQHYQPDDHCNNFLSRIEISLCRSLTKLPADFRGLNSLTYLAIEWCGSLKSFPDGIQYLPALETLIIGGFSKDLEHFPFPAATGSDGGRYFVSLRELEIHGWASLGDVFPEEIQHITSLQRFKIDWYDLLSLPEWFGKLSSLQTLDIENCKNIRYLPPEEQMQRLTSLQTLTISGCLLLQERCRPGNEESIKLADFNLTKDGTGSSKYERMGDTTSRKSRKGKEKV